jgi:hypothetical protein
MRNTLITLTAALLAAGSSAAFAASSVDLSVKGVITPSACVPTLSAGGVYDIGKISAKDLNVEKYTRLQKGTLQLAVTCDAMTLMALEGKDNRAGSGFLEDYLFGLGLINGDEKLGTLLVKLTSPTADGSAGRIIESVDNGASWAASSSLLRDNIISFADNTVDAPIPIKQLTADLELEPIIAPTNSLTLDNEVAIDGSVTVTVRYL